MRRTAAERRACRGPRSAKTAQRRPAGARDETAAGMLSGSIGRLLECPPVPACARPGAWRLAARLPRADRRGLALGHLARGIGWRPAAFHLDRSGARGAWGRGGRKRARLRRLCLGDPHVDRPGELGSRKRARLRRLCRRRAHGLRRAAGEPPRAGRRALGPRPARSLHLRAPSPLRAPGPARPARRLVPRRRD